MHPVLCLFDVSWRGGVAFCLIPHPADLELLLQSLAFLPSQLRSSLRPCYRQAPHARSCPGGWWHATKAYLASSLYPRWQSICRPLQWAADHPLGHARGRHTPDGGVRFVVPCTAPEFASGYDLSHGGRPERNALRIVRDGRLHPLRVSCSG